MKIICVILLLNTAAALVFWLTGLVKKRSRTKNTIEALVILLCPLVGPLYLLFSKLIDRLFFSNQIDRNIVSFSRSRRDSLTVPEEEEEMNLVPMSEALAVSHKTDQRRLLLQVLKTNSERSLGSVRLALESEDSETSHYAASAILDLTAKFEADAERMLKQVRENPDNLSATLNCAEELNAFLRQNVLSELEQKSYVYEAEGVYENLYLRHRERMESSHYLEITELLLRAGDIQAAEHWAERGMEEKELELDAYRAMLQVLYAKGDRQAFFQCLDKLKKSDVRFDEQMLEMIRFLN